jgi:hypothetical protein
MKMGVPTGAPFSILVPKTWRLSELVTFVSAPCKQEKTLQ